VTANIGQAWLAGFWFWWFLFLSSDNSDLGKFVGRKYYWILYELCGDSYYKSVEITRQARRRCPLTVVVFLTISVRFGRQLLLFISFSCLRHVTHLLWQRSVVSAVL